MNTDNSKLFQSQLTLIFATGLVRHLNYFRVGAPPPLADFDAVIDAFPARLSGVNPGDLRARVRTADLAGVSGVGASTDVIEDPDGLTWQIVSVAPEFNGEGVALQLRRASAATAVLQVPCMTRVERNALSAIAAGSAIFQTDNLPGLRVFNGANWIRYQEFFD